MSIKTTNKQSVDLGTLNPGLKHWCGSCKSVVMSVNHERSCRTLVDPIAHSRLVRLAWLGDARHVTDVRAVLLSAKVDDDRLQSLAAEYVCKDSQVIWFNNYKGNKMSPMGKSKHSVATAFKASYHGKFRDDYLLWLVTQFVIIGLDPVYEHYL